MPVGPSLGTVTSKTWLLAPILAVSVCGAPSRASLQVSISPNPIQIKLSLNCGIGPAGCGPSTLNSNWTVTVAETNGVGGRGVVTTLILDPTTGLPLPGQDGSVTGTSSFALSPNSSASLPQVWRWVIQTNVTPTKLSFVTTVDFTDSLNNRIGQSITVSGVANGYTVS